MCGPPACRILGGMFNRERLRPVVVVLDGSSHDLETAWHGAELAARQGAPVHLAMLAQSRDRPGTMLQRAQAPADLQHAIGALGDADAALHEVLERGPAGVTGHVLRGLPRVRALAKRLDAAVVVLAGPRVPVELRFGAPWEVVVAPGASRARRVARLRTATS